MKRFLPLLILTFIVFSCGKKYKIVINKEKEDPTTPWRMHTERINKNIRAKSDRDAFIEAARLFYKEEFKDPEFKYKDFYLYHKDGNSVVLPEWFMTQTIHDVRVEVGKDWK